MLLGALLTLDDFNFYSSKDVMLVKFLCLK